jgi:DivIVA domain-containing protein
MNEHDVQRIRNATFTAARRGYDQREVDQFLTELAEWLEGGALDEAGSFAVQRKLERAGETAGRILGAAEQESEQLLREAREEARRIVSEANTSARSTIDAAREKARRTVDEGDQRRESLEKLIQSLVLTRDSVLQQLDELATRLENAAAAHRPAPGKDPFARPRVLDPAERTPGSGGGGAPSPAKEPSPPAASEAPAPEKATDAPQPAEQATTT